MKIVCLSASRIPSDTANSIQVMKTCQALTQLGHTVTLLVPAGPQGQAGERELSQQYGLTSSFEVRWLHLPWRRSFSWLAVREARRAGAQALYVWPLQSAVWGLMAGFPILLEMHDFPSGRFGPLWYRAFLGLGGTKRLLVITRALQEGLERTYGPGRPAVEAVLAPNGVDLERFAGTPAPEQARRQLGLVQAPTVGCTGHLYAGRGANLFLDLAGRFPHAQFLWVGGRPQDVEEWRRRARACGAANVTFTGFIPNDQLPLYQAAADILVMPYDRQIAVSSGPGRSADISSPMKMFEYLASGRAILASDLPVFHEVLDPTTAVFCPPEDPQAWERELGALLKDPARRSVFGQKALQAAQAHTWQERARRCLDGFKVTPG